MAPSYLERDLIMGAATAFAKVLKQDVGKIHQLVTHGQAWKMAG